MIRTARKRDLAFSSNFEFRFEFWNRFLNLLSEIGENTVIILSTHIVEDVKELCTDMAIINQGEVIYKGSPMAAIDQIKGKVWKKHLEKGQLDEYRNKFTVISDRRIAGKPQINVLADSNPGDGFIPVEPDLEDVYFAKIFGEVSNAQPVQENAVTA